MRVKIFLLNISAFCLCNSPVNLMISPVASKNNEVVGLGEGFCFPNNEGALYFANKFEDMQKKGNIRIHYGSAFPCRVDLSRYAEYKLLSFIKKISKNPQISQDLQNSNYNSLFLIAIDRGNLTFIPMKDSQISTEILEFWGISEVFKKFAHYRIRTYMDDEREIKTVRLSAIDRLGPTPTHTPSRIIIHSLSTESIGWLKIWGPWEKFIKDYASKKLIF